MTEHELRQRVCDKAKSWLGLREPTTFRPIMEQISGLLGGWNSAAFGYSA